MYVSSIHIRSIVNVCFMHLALAPEVDDLTGILGDVKRAMYGIVSGLLDETPGQLTVWLHLKVHPMNRGSTRKY